MSPWSSQPRNSIAKTSQDQATFRQVPATFSTNAIEDQSLASARQRRPIDLRFEQMRSYSEMPFQQSVYNSHQNPQIIPQAINPPTPPPKAPHPFYPTYENASTSSQQENVLDGRKQVHETRFNTWNQRIFNSAQRQPQMPIEQVSQPSQQITTMNQQRYIKPKLNLRNPMALLARKRSQRIKDSDFAENQKTAPLKLPDDYDPRIRGHVVHDFSAPRADRHLPAKPDEEAERTKRQRLSVPNLFARRDASPSSGEREHTPIFKEHFDVGLEKAQDPEQKSESLQRMAVAASRPQPRSSQLPSFARNLPLNVSPHAGAEEKPLSQQNIASLTVLIEPPDQGQSHAAPSPSMSPPRAASIAASISDRSTSGLGSPQRYRSTSSRFSFDLAGVGSSTQEKLLEDKHRQKVQQKQRQSTLSDEATDDDEQYLDFGGAAEDAFEERIPGVNCDDNYDYDNDISLQDQMPTLQRDMESFQIASPNKSSFESTTSPISTGVTSLDTPRDFLGLPWHTALAAKSSPNLSQLQADDTVPALGSDVSSRPRSTPDDPSRNVPTSNALQHKGLLDTHLVALPQRQSIIDDDMYFDDGIIDEIGEVSDQDFDEDVFDDTGHGLYGLPLRDRNLKPVNPIELEGGSNAEGNNVTEIIRNKNFQSRDGLGCSSPHRSLSSGGMSAELRDALTELGQPNRHIFSQTAGLTHDNLAAYNHNALALAVNQAAMDGAFDRAPTVGTSQEPQPDSTGLPSLSLEDNGATGVEFSLPANEDFGDDELDDDDIVAAANAEALENDDDGFYGQEFGFFARASGTSEVEYSNGGYFGPRTIEGVHRSHSGKANFQEPSLTPITERSEWSNRNSFIFGHPLSAVAATNPAFNDQAADDLNVQYAMLKQLRRGAWGGSGSDMSLQSSSNSQNSGSPITFVGPSVILPSPLQTSSTNLQNMASSFHSFNSSSNGRPSSNDSDSNDSPTITLPTQQTPGMVLPPSSQSMAPPPSVPITVQENRPNTARSSGLKSIHSRNSSVAESVSYKEEGGKWVIEKRRMSETGERVVGRSVIEGARI
ncbi:uncharacterized protein KY384_004294 [Bacidia gigantensis]|uniref:uncharacterized protein n=1 Tax=Bacidia gigantensis TaxID=2732470 RepID=UPI001D052449|nr:uncharacterized protein KY384_004294 [Bacidia gigantensis]KAG8530937.1 hypothetical protein KY384_004294 [Bacidia gigantensis]